MSLSLRRVLPHESESLIPWIKQYCAYDHITLTEDSIRKNLPLLLSENSPFGASWFIDLTESTGEIITVGYSILTYSFDLEFGGRMATLTDLFLLENYRKRGLGSQVFEKIFEFMKTNGLMEMELQVETQNIAAQKFYSKTGFKKVDRFTLTKSLRE